MAGFSGFIPALLAALKAPDTPQNRLFLQAWQRAEGGGASFNPFNTTEPAPGATNYNGVGVKNFTNPSEGVRATVETLLNGHYGNIVNDLRSGSATAAQLGTDVARSPWGTGSGVLRVLGTKADAAWGTPGGSKPVPGQKPPTGLMSSPAPFNQLLSQFLLNQAAQELSGGDQASLGGSGLLQLALARKALTAAAGSKGSLPTPPPGSMAAPKGRTLASSGAAGGFLPKGASYSPGRNDQGHDFQTDPGAPIIAPGDGVVVSVKSDPRGFGPSYPIVHFTSGPYAGKDIYIGHTISQLQPGQRFSAGSVLSVTGKTPIGNAQVPGWAEIGFAPGGLPGVFGQSVPFS